MLQKRTIQGLDRDDLRDFCHGAGAHAAANAVPTYFNVSDIFDAESVSLPDDRIGIFGNADPLDASQWPAYAALFLPSVFSPSLYFSLSRGCRRRKHTGFCISLSFARAPVPSDGKILYTFEPDTL